MLDMRGWRDWWANVPAECPGCAQRVAGQGFCAACRSALMPAPLLRCDVCRHVLHDGRCEDCVRRPPAYDRIVMAFDYGGLARTLVRAYKHAGQQGLSTILADQLVQAVRASATAPMPRWVVPIPAHRAALQRRGFSPPAEIARVLAHRLGLSCRLSLLRRQREGGIQARLPLAERLHAQEAAFACDAGPWLAGQTVAVVDDVLTTGATLHAAAMALKAAGAGRVEGWVLARTLDVHAGVGVDTAIQ